MPRTLPISILRAALVVELVAHAVLFLWVVIGRLGYPFEIEFMTGSVLDHIERVLRHEKIYVAPGAGFIPFLYPPLYYWVCAAVGGTVAACRSVSVLATLVQAVAAAGIARALGAGRAWSSGAGAVVLATFSFVGFWFDLERSDNLLGGLVVLAAFVLIRYRGVAASLGAGALLGIALLAKQQAIFYMVGAAVGLVATRRTGGPSTLPETASFLVAAAATAIGASVVAYDREGSWIVYYCVHVPLSHGIDPHILVDALLVDAVEGFALFAATALFLARAVGRFRAGQAQRGEVLFAALLGAGFLGAISSRIHIGGWVNVLIPWTAFASVALVLVVARSDAFLAPRRRSVPLAATVLQLAVWGHDPNERVPIRVAATERAKLDVVVQTLEQSGPVLVPSRGHVTAPRRFHIAALADIARAEGHPPADLVTQIDTRAFAAILDDAWARGKAPPPYWPPVFLEDVVNLREPLLRNYYVAGWLDDSVMRLQLVAPVLPRWIYRRRTRPPANLDALQLRERQLREMLLARGRDRAILDGMPTDYTAEDIERLAAEP